MHLKDAGGQVISTSLLVNAVYFLSTQSMTAKLRGRETQYWHFGMGINQGLED